MKKIVLFLVVALFMAFNFSVLGQNNTKDFIPKIEKKRIFSSVESTIEGKNSPYTNDEFLVSPSFSLSKVKKTQKRGSKTILDTLKLVDLKRSAGAPKNWLTNTNFYSPFTLKGYPAANPYTGTDYLSMYQKYISLTPVKIKGVGIVMKALNTTSSNVKVTFYGKKTKGGKVETLGEVTKAVAAGNPDLIYFNLATDIIAVDTFIFQIAPVTNGVDSIQVYTNGKYGNTTTATASITGTTLTVTSYKDIGFSLGQVISGAGVTPGTRIMKQTGNGVFTVDKTQSVASTTITAKTFTYGYDGGTLGIYNVPTSGNPQKFQDYIYWNNTENKPYETDVYSYPIVEYTWDSNPTIDNKCLGTNKTIKVTGSSKDLISNPLFNKAAFYQKYLGFTKADKQYYHYISFAKDKSADQIDESSPGYSVSKVYTNDLNDTINVYEYLISYNAKTSVNTFTSQFLVSSSLVATPSSQNATGNNADGKATVNVTGGFSPYIYSWTNSSATTNSITVAPGTYKPTIVDANQCSLVASDIVVSGTQSPKSTEKDFLTYSINGVNGVISGTNITVTLPSGTDLTNLTAVYTTSPKSTITTGANTTNFTNVVTYVVTAEDLTTKTYTVTVTASPKTQSSACDVTSFSLGLTTGTIVNNVITLILPSGSSLTQVATFTLSTGATAKIGSITQQSGVTSSNYSADVAFEVTAEDGTKKTYTIKVTVAQAPVTVCKDLDNWKDGNNTTPNLSPIGSGGYITDGYLTGVNKYYFQGLYEKFSNIGDSKSRKLTSVKYWFGALKAGSPTNTMNFIVTTPNKTTKLPNGDTLYLVTKLVKDVEAALDKDGYYVLDLSSLNVKVNGDFYAGLNMKYKNAWAGVAGANPQDTIALVHNDYAAAGATINSAYFAQNTQTGFVYDTLVAKTDHLSLGIFANVCDLSTANDLLSFNFTNPVGTVSTSGNTITLTLPNGTNSSVLTSLIASFTSSPKSTVSIGQVAQVSGQTANDFSASKVYTVTAEDGSTKNYTVTVIIQQSPKSTEKDFLTYSINGVNGVISGTNITLTLPAGTDLTNLTAVYTTSAKSSVTSGAATVNFTNPVSYTITAEDLTTKTYTVTVTASPKTQSSACDVTSFSLGLTTGTIVNNVITLILPSGSSLTQVATFSLSTGATAKIGSISQQSGVTSSDYSADVAFEVTAEDGTKKTYTIKVTVAQAPVTVCKDLDNWKDGNNTTPNLSPIGSGGYITDGYLTGVNKYYFQGLYEKFSNIGDSKSRKLTSVKYWFGALKAGSPTNTMNFIVTTPNKTTKLPNGDTLYLVTKLVKDVEAALDKDGYYVLDLSSLNVKVNGDFYAGLNMKYKNAWAGVAGANPQDTIALVHNDYAAAGATINSAYFAQNTQTGFVYDTLVGKTDHLSLGIFANVCDLSTANDLLSFNFTNPVGAVSTSGNTITLTLPNGTNPSVLTSLIASFTSSPKSTVSIGQVLQVSGQTTNDFSASKIYTVTAEDGSTKNYTITVIIQQSQKSTEKDFLTYSINGVNGVISGTNITLTLPAGTDLSNLTATYTTSPKSTVTTGANTTNFTNVVTYVVTAEDLTTKTYTVTVTSSPKTQSSACDVTSFSLGLTTGTIVNNVITLILPSGSSLTQVATFTLSTGATAKIGSITQQSGVTSSNYSADVAFEVTAEDGTKKTYTIKVTVAQAPVTVCKDLDNWKDGNNTTPNLSPIGSGGYITDGYLTGVNKYYFQGLYEKFSNIGDSKSRKLTSVKYWFGALKAGSPTNTMNFIVTTPNKTTKLPNGDTLYLVTKLVKDVEAALDKDGYYVLDLSSLNVKVNGDFYAGLNMKYKNAWAGVAGANPQDTIALVHNDYAAAGATINSAYFAQNTQTGFVYDTLVGKTDHLSLGIFANVCDLSTANDLLSFNFTNPVGAVSTSGNTITLTLPNGTNPSVLTSLIASFTSSPKSTVSIGQVLQVSGQTTNDFSASKIYTVTAEDGSTKNYTITVIIQQSQKSTEKDFLTYSINGVNGVISGTNITLTLPAGTDLSNLTATYTTSPKSTVTTGANTTNFTNVVTYVVTAEDLTTKTYTVTVTVSSTNQNTGADLLTFGFTNPNVTGVISGTNITVTVPYGTNIKSLVSTFTTSTGAVVKVSNIVQLSGGSVVDYSAPVSFVVTSQDGKTVKTYIVNVTITPLLSSAKDLLTLGFASPSTVGTISGNTVGLTVPFGTNVAALIANFTSSPNSIVRVGSTIQISGTTANNFTSSVLYTVVAQDGSTKDYTVVVTVSSQNGGTGTSAKEILSFGLLNPYINGAISGNTITITGQAGSDISKQQIYFSISPGATLTLNGVVLTTNVSIINFSNPVTVTVTATDGTKKDYIITVSIPKKNGKLITFFKFLEVPSATTTIDDVKKIITVHVPYGTSLNLTSVFGVSTGATVTIGGIIQASGASQISYATDVNYVVTAEDGTKTTYTIKVIVDPKTAGIEEVDNALVRIYPNPSNGAFTCESSIEAYDLLITDILGHIVYSSRVEPNGTGAHTFDVSDFGSGVYFATLQFEGTSKMFKLEVIK